MPPLAKAAARTAAAAAAAAAHHPLVARKLSTDNLSLLVGLLILTVSLLPFILFHMITHFRKGGTVLGYFKDLLKMCSIIVGILVFLPGLILYCPYKILKPTTAPAAAPAPATAAPARRFTTQPPPLAHPTMPLDPVELAPEDPGLDDPDDPASYLRRAPLPGAASAAASAAAVADDDDGPPPTFEEATVQKPEAAILRPEPPPPEYQPDDPGRGEGRAL